MLRLATAAVLVSLLSAHAFAWEVDPTKGIVPLDHAAKLYHQGEEEAALANLADKMARYSARYDELVQLSNEANDEAIGSTERSILTLNAASATHLKCMIEHQWRVDGEPPDQCRHMDGAWSVWVDDFGFRYGIGFLREQFTNPTLSAAAFDWFMLEFNFFDIDEDYPQLYPLCRVNFTIDSFGAARLARAQIIEGQFRSILDIFDKVRRGRWRIPDNAEAIIGSSSVKRKIAGICTAQFSDIVKPGPVFTYEAILALMAGNYEHALTAGREALASDVQIAFDDDFNHPLLWTLSASHRLGRDEEKEDLLEVARSLRGEFRPDARAALDHFIELPAADDVIVTCGSAGCHYFTAQYLQGLGQAASARRELEAGAQYCIETTSVPCTAINVALRSIETKPAP